MKTADKFLILIVAAVVGLVTVTFAVALLHPKAGYQPEDTPEGVANNYLYALQQGDYERAYGYLSPTMKFYPASAATFRHNIESASRRYERMDFDGSSPTLQINSARIVQNRAIVTVQKTSFYYGSSLFSSNEYRSTFKMTLVKDHPQAGWKILLSDEYQAWCWGSENPCR